MSSGTELIHAALKRIGAHSVVSPADPETVDTARNTLNSMLEGWRSKGIDMGTVPINAPGDEVSEPLDVRQAIIDNLAMLLAPNKSSGKPVVSPELRVAAASGMRSIRVLYQKINVPNKKVSSTMPMGAGSTRGVWASNFAGQDREIES